jgi:predicted SnoaL-like aldol condensation-catalyzing enzyme
MSEDRIAIATRFLQLAAGGEAVAKAAALTTADFRHHNVHFASDGPALFEAMDANARQFPDKRIDLKQAIADGDRVATLCKVAHTPDEAGYIVCHWFRFEGDRIAELWDLAQEIPQTSPNRLGPF